MIPAEPGGLKTTVRDAPGSAALPRTVVRRYPGKTVSLRTAVPEAQVWAGGLGTGVREGPGQTGRLRTRVRGTAACTSLERWSLAGAGNFTGMRRLLAVGLLGLMGCAGRVPVARYIPEVRVTRRAIDPLERMPAHGRSAESVGCEFVRAPFYPPDKREALERRNEPGKRFTHPVNRAATTVRPRSLGHYQAQPGTTHRNSYPPPEDNPYRTAAILYKILGWTVGIGGIALGVVIGSWLGVLVAVVLVVLGMFLGLWGAFINGDMP